MLYAIIDTEVCRDRSCDPVDAAAACIRGGATLLQLRQKSSTSALFLDRADRMVRLAHARGARVIINDRADIAAMSGADGVHLGQDDLDLAAARAVVGRDATVGLSTHTREQIDSALASTASYVAVGPVFETATKATGYEARGLALIRYASGRGKPIVGIGGITLTRAPQVIAAGAFAVAVITDLLVGPDVETRVRAFVNALPAPPLKV